MSKRNTKSIVIDACIAHSAGGRNSPVSYECSEFLRRIFKICHTFAISDKLKEEWEKHRTPYALRWYNSMHSKDKIEEIGDIKNNVLRDKIINSGLTNDELKTVLKDIHILEAALETDKIVISTDDRVRNLLKGISASIIELRDIIWVNPKHDLNFLLYWLKKGANPREDLKLGYSDNT